MKKTQRSYRGWLALLIAIALWAFVIYSYRTVDLEKTNFVALASTDEQASQKEAWLIKLHGLLNETKQERASLVGVLPQDVIAFVDSIEALSKTAGIEIHMSGVQPENTKGAKPGTAPGVNFTIQASGSFAQIMRVVQLLDSMSYPTQIQQLELSNSGLTWQLTANVRALTAS